MQAEFRGHRSPSASFLQLFLGSRGRKLQFAHVSAHSVTNTELLGSISTVMGTIISMDVDFLKGRARRLTGGGWEIPACIPLRCHGGGSTRPFPWPFKIQSSVQEMFLWYWFLLAAIGEGRLGV